MTEALKGNTKPKVLNPKQIQSTNDQMTKTFRIWAFGFRYCLVFSSSARDEPLGLSSSALSSLPKGSGRRLSRVDFEFRASNFRFRHLNTYDQFWRDFYKLLLGSDTSYIYRKKRDASQWRSSILKYQIFNEAKELQKCFLWKPGYFGQIFRGLLLW